MSLHNQEVFQRRYTILLVSVRVITLCNKNSHNIKPVLNKHPRESSTSPCPLSKSIYAEKDKNVLALFLEWFPIQNPLLLQFEFTPSFTLTWNFTIIYRLINECSFSQWLGLEKQEGAPQPWRNHQLPGHYDPMTLLYWVYMEIQNGEPYVADAGGQPSRAQYPNRSDTKTWIKWVEIPPGHAAPWTELTLNCQ